jgi:hypothetical protein
MSHDAIFLGDSQVQQLIISIRLDEVQAILELGIKTSAKAITLLSISVSMIIRVLTQVVESLSILENGASSLGKSQKLIQLHLHKPF